MKTIGLIGGMSWESTVTYYQVINTVVKEQLGGLHSAKILLYSVDFAEIERCQSSDDWGRAAEILADIARRLERAGAELLLICANTMHRVFDEVQAAVSVPLLHIGELTAQALTEAGIHKAALLGTRYVMEGDFYPSRLRAAGIEVVTPNAEERAMINRVIYEELCIGILSETSKAAFLAVVERLAREEGAEGVVLGCTEIPLLIGQEKASIPFFDTTQIHAGRAARMALE